ncbi:MAG: ATP synthase F1 subunit gamma [Verrucomicrobia bacterium]|nr:ATP synthase F1 subunit gamma [Verrucomicrobiota bacterium]MCH8511996.1 ATP synthase F1 subunit gamma [Kiritimatiellia bacterium]
MPSIKEYNSKINSLKNTSKITKTMKMVSASKLRKAQESQRNAKDFAHEVNQLIRRIAGNVDENLHPLLKTREEEKKVLVVIFTSDKGLCGGFNNNLIRFAERYFEERKDDGIDYELAFCGRRGYLHFQSRATIHRQFDLVSADPGAHTASRVMKHLEKVFLDGSFDRIMMMVNEFISPLSQIPRLHQLLPLTDQDLEKGESEAVAPVTDILSEPGMEQLLSFLVPRLVSFKVYFALLENAAGEHGARMTAMDNATTNAANLIEENTLLRNRARQAAITTELIEIISGAEAL